MDGSSRCSCLRVIGVYGLVRYTVARRSRDVGIRIALGADAAGVAREVLGSSKLQAARGECVE